MKKISGPTFFYKRVFPCVWFGIIALFLVLAMVGPSVARAPLVARVGSVGMPLALAAFGYFMFRRMIWDLADEVFDTGDELVFRRGDVQQRVPLHDVVNISHAAGSSPERVVVTVRTRGALGTDLAFSLPMRFNPFSKPAIVRELIDRVDRAKRR